eukprot:8343272-Karenia_brevis.AAC.1
MMVGTLDLGRRSCRASKRLYSSTLVALISLRWSRKFKHKPSRRKIKPGDSNGQSNGKTKTCSRVRRKVDIWCIG